MMKRDFMLSISYRALLSFFCGTLLLLGTACQQSPEKVAPAGGSPTSPAPKPKEPRAFAPPVDDAIKEVKSQVSRIDKQIDDLNSKKKKYTNTENTFNEVMGKAASPSQPIEEIGRSQSEFLYSLNEIPSIYYKNLLNPLIQLALTSPFAKVKTQAQALVIRIQNGTKSDPIESEISVLDEKRRLAQAVSSELESFKDVVAKLEREQPDQIDKLVQVERRFNEVSFALEKVERDLRTNNFKEPKEVNVAFKQAHLSIRQAALQYWTEAKTTEPSQEAFADQIAWNALESPLFMMTMPEADTYLDRITNRSELGNWTTTVYSTHRRYGRLILSSPEIFNAMKNVMYKDALYLPLVDRRLKIFRINYLRDFIQSKLNALFLPRVITEANSFAFDQFMLDRARKNLKELSLLYSEGFAKDIDTIDGAVDELKALRNG